MIIGSPCLLVSSFSVECVLLNAAYDTVTADDLEDLEVYGNDQADHTGSQLTQYSFEVSYFNTVSIMSHSFVLISSPPVN